MEGVVELVLNATRDNQAALTAERLFGWHAALFPTGYSGLARINVGGWRDDADGPMQVVSARSPAHACIFRRPPNACPPEIQGFLDWINAPPANRR